MHIANKRSQSFWHFFASPVPHQRYAMHEHRATVILASLSFLVSSAPAASAIHAEVIIGRRVSQHFRRFPSHSNQRGPFFLAFLFYKWGVHKNPSSLKLNCKTTLKVENSSSVSRNLRPIFNVDGDEKGVTVCYNVLQCVTMWTIK